MGSALGSTFGSNKDKSEKKSAQDSSKQVYIDEINNDSEQKISEIRSRRKSTTDENIQENCEAKQSTDSEENFESPEEDVSEREELAQKNEESQYQGDFNQLDRKANNELHLNKTGNSKKDHEELLKVDKMEEYITHNSYSHRDDADVETDNTRKLENSQSQKKNHSKPRGIEEMENFLKMIKNNETDSKLTTEDTGNNSENLKKQNENVCSKSDGSNNNNCTKNVKHETSEDTEDVGEIFTKEQPPADGVSNIENLSKEENLPEERSDDTETKSESCDNSKKENKDTCSEPEDPKNEHKNLEKETETKEKSDEECVRSDISNKDNNIQNNLLNGRNNTETTNVSEINNTGTIGPEYVKKMKEKFDKKPSENDTSNEGSPNKKKTSLPKERNKKKPSVSKEHTPVEDVSKDEKLPDKNCSENFKLEQSDTLMEEHEDRRIPSHQDSKKSAIREDSSHQPDYFKKQTVGKQQFEILVVHKKFQDLDLENMDNSVQNIDVIQEYAKKFEDEVINFKDEKYSLEYFVLKDKLTCLMDKLGKIKCSNDPEATKKRIEVMEYFNELHSILEKNAYQS